MFCRCFYVAQSYAGAKKWKEAMGLYARVLEYADGAQKQFKTLSKGSLYKVCRSICILTGV